MTVKFILS